MVTWEYERLEIEFAYGAELNDRLNELGVNGWEIIYYNETRAPKFGDKHKVIVLLKKRRDENKKCT